MSNIKRIKQQEYFQLCKTKNYLSNKTRAYFEENKYYLQHDYRFANECLIACCQADNWNDFYHVFDDLIYLQRNCGGVQLYLENHQFRQKQSWVGANDIHYDIPLHYMLHLTCQMKYEHLFHKICQKMKTLECLSFVIDSCFRIAKNNLSQNMLHDLATYFPQLVYIVCNCNNHKSYHYAETKEKIQQIQTKQRHLNQLFMLWFISNNSPKKDSIWFQLPRDISRYIIHQFI